jgi:hypothetical protein
MCELLDLMAHADHVAFEGRYPPFEFDAIG